MITTAHYTIGTTVTMIVPADDMVQRALIHNNDAALQVFLGGADVTTSSGMHLDGKEEREITLNPSEALYAVATADRSISVMIQTQ